jgi:hypothetical protein
LAGHVRFNGLTTGTVWCVYVCICMCLCLCVCVSLSLCVCVGGGQLLTARGVIVQDLRCTLPNLYLLLSHEAEVQARRREALRATVDAPP